MYKLFRIYGHSFKGLSAESWMLSIVMLLNRAGAMVLPFLGVYMVDHLHFSIEASGMVLSCFGLGSLAGSWIGGYVTDKIGEYKVQSFSLFASVPMFCLLPLFSTPAALGAMVFIQSTTSEIFRPANSVAITKYARPENLTKSFSLNRMAVNLGFSVGPALGGLLATVSYNFLFFTNAATALLSGIIYVSFFRKRHNMNRKSSAHLLQKNRADHKEISPYRDVPFYVFCIFCSILSICFFQLLNSLPLFYKEAVLLTQTQIGLLLGFSGVIVVLFEMLLVHIAERKWTIAITMVIGTLVCAVSYGMLAFGHHLVWLYFSIALLSLGEIFVLPFMSTVTAMRSGINNKGAYMGMNGIFVALAFIISPILSTRIAHAFGFEQLWLWTGIVLALTSIGFYCSINGLKKM